MDGAAQSGQMAGRHGSGWSSGDSGARSHSAGQRYGEDRWDDHGQRYGERRWDERQWDERRWDEEPGWRDRRGDYGDSQRYDGRRWDDAQWYDEAGDDRPARAADGSGQQGASGGAEGNERLTALTGAALLVLFALEGLTILSVHQLLTLHFFLGILIIGPVGLKACAVLYRFARYYTGAPEYRRKGPPSPLLRMLGPVVLLSSLGVLGTGVILAITGPSGANTWFFLHRATFVIWFGAMTVHVLAYVWRLPRLVTSDLVSHAGHRAQEVLAGRWARWGLLAASLLTGLMLAMITVHRVNLWSTWLH